ncbi:kpl2-related [Holotrichia oblita]|uniref:Kpl2-related n=1 Tax=Holotrichia oblita TaxID=644536 RepID=A0ACB9SST7_HOLOL|nr:kpl2-related [Holotrichia oblita]
MSDVIGKWLTETLGIIVEVYSETFVRLIQNGYLVGAILRHYNIITADQLTSLTSAGDTTNAIDKISYWLKLVDIHLDDDDRKQLQKGKISKALELFYKLYLSFQSKDLVHFTAKQIKTEKLREGNDRFSVTPVKQDLPDRSNVPPHTLSWILSDYRHVVQWHIDRYQQLLRRCEQLRANYEYHMASRIPTRCTGVKLPVEHSDEVDELLNEDDVKSLHETYSDLIDQEQKVLAQGPFIPDIKKTKKIVKNIKKKYEKERLDIAFQSKMETMVLAQFWDELFQTQSKRVEANISEKMLKQSYYEKQMMNKLFELRERKEIMAENRITIQMEIQKKNDSEFLEHIFNQQKDTASERYRYYFERDRVLELHKRIYNEKKRLKAQRTYDMCESILEDLIDIAFKRAEYKREYDAEIPRCMLTDLAGLFVSSQTILDLLPDIEVIVENEPANEVEEEIYSEEIDRQNAIDEISFENYCTFSWPWDLNERLPDYEKNYSLHNIEMAMNVLGHIVFRLLLSKYPKPLTKRPPNIPKVQIAVAVNNISDLSIIPILRKLLSERQIKVIQIPDVINYCVSIYRDETTEEYQESQFFDETEDALQKVEQQKSGKKVKPEKSKEIKQKGDKKGVKKIPIQEATESCETIMYQEKQVQTPKIFPGGGPKLSSAAQLGQIAYEVLQLGEGLSDALIVQMFVEYLKGLKDINGWCLINYPSTIAQSILLEEALTAKSVPITLEVPKNESRQEDNATQIKNPGISCNDIKSTDSFGLKALFASRQSKSESCTDRAKKDTQMDLEANQNNNNDTIEDIADLHYREVKQNTIIDDANAQYRKSRILNNPDSPETIEDYDCYLTAFIRLIQDVPSQEKLSADDILDDLDKFYQSQGCLYSLYYKIFDLATIKHMGKLIIGDYSIPPKSSVQIFGDMVLYLENDLKQGDPILGKASVSKFGGSKKEKPPKSPQKKSGTAKSTGTVGKREKATKSGKDGKKNKKGEEEPNVVIVKADKETQIPEPPAEYEEIHLPEEPPTPGQNKWKYVDLPIPEFFEIALATLWENVEEVYVCDFRELFFRRRILWNTVMPYLAFVKQYMRDYIDRPDNKQIHLYNFQRLYNEIAEDMRDDNEVKAELHCRIHEFKEKMFEICDTRMNEAETERHTIITQDWTSKQACELTNLYIISLQLEIDRSVDTLQLLNDYYVSMITKMPCADEVIQKIFLEYITFNDEFEFENCLSYSKFVRNALAQGDIITYDSPYHKLVSSNHSEAVKAIGQYKQISMNILSNMEAYFQPKGKKGTSAKKESKVKGRALPKFSAPEPAVKEVGLKLIEEWQCAIEGEYARACLRLDLLKAVAYEDVRHMLISSVKTFHGLYQEIKDRYDQEIKSIQKCCGVLARAVEEEMAIQPELILKGDKFYINPDVLLFEDSLPEPEPILKEYEKPGTFTIAQLCSLTDILFDLAPKGIMPERAFIFLLQDLIVNDAEDGRPSVVPQLWQQLPLRNVNKLSYEFFGHVELVDWKDFIIYNLCVEFPDEVQLMQTRRQFRDFDVDANEYVYDYQFYAIKFWFESEFDQENPQEALRLREIKKLLFRLFKISMDRVNYTALLLTFCKNSEGYLGLAKALSLSLGKEVCWDIEIGKTFSTILRQRQLEQLQDKIRLELEQAAKVETVDEVVEDLIDITVHQCDSVCLESYHSYGSRTGDEDGVNNDEVVDPELVYLENLMKEYENSYQMPDEEEQQFLLQEEFSNVEIGFQPEFYPSKVYYLSFDVLLTVVMAAMPWEAISKNNDEFSLRQLLEDTYNKCKNEEFDNVVLMHEFLNNETVKEIFTRTNKFIVRRPLQILNKLLDR